MEICVTFTLLPHPSTLSAYKGTPKWGHLKPTGRGQPPIIVFRAGEGIWPSSRRSEWETPS